MSTKHFWFTLMLLPFFNQEMEQVSECFCVSKSRFWTNFKERTFSQLPPFMIQLQIFPWSVHLVLKILFLSHCWSVFKATLRALPHQLEVDTPLPPLHLSPLSKYSIASLYSMNVTEFLVGQLAIRWSNLWHLKHLLANDAAKVLPF